MLSNDYLVDCCKTMLNLDDTTIYDKRVNIVVGGSINKLQSEGVSNIYEEGSNEGYDYALCIAYMVALDLDLVTDFNRLYTQYLTRVVTLREKQKSNV